MKTPNRRDALKTGSVFLASAVAHMSAPGFVFPGEEAEGELVPFINNPRTGPNRLDWETLAKDEWLTPQDQVFSVQHYGIPKFDAKTFKLKVGGLVEKPMSLSLEQLRARDASEQLMTLECSGNGASPGFSNAIYNSNWKGTLLAPLLKEAGIKDGAIEVVFFGIDQKKESIRRGVEVDVPFGRSVSLNDAMNSGLMLAYERNGKPLELRNGAPLRVIAPGRYGIANVKWVHRIEVRDRRYMGRYMARDYVTVRGEKKNGEVTFVETSVYRMNLKSVVARVTRGETAGGKVPLQVFGAAWDDGTGIAKVEVKLGDGKWQEATLHKEPSAKYSWTFYSLDLGNVEPGKYEIVSRATGVDGRVQPSKDDDEIALKKTYWEAYAQWVREIEVEA